MLIKRFYVYYNIVYMGIVLNYELDFYQLVALKS
jgi:hypothetical protein